MAVMIILTIQYATHHLPHLLLSVCPHLFLYSSSLCTSVGAWTNHFYDHNQYVNQLLNMSEWYVHLV